METRTGETRQPEADRLRLRQLENVLRRELSAAATYLQVMTKLSTSSYRVALEECMRSHQSRVLVITRAIERQGGTATTRAGTWGSYARIAQGPSNVGERALVAALAEGEEGLRADYQRDIEDLVPEVRTLVAHLILPEQQKTQRSMQRVQSLLG